MALHKKLTRKGRKDLGTDLNDYDLSFLPTPGPGPFKCEEDYVEIFDLEFFDKNLLRKSRQEFQRAAIKAIGIEEFAKIERGLAAYVLSSKSKEKPLLVLKKSLHQFDFDWLEAFKSQKSLLELQHLRPEDLEKFEPDPYDTITDGELIHTTSLEKYIKLATRITKKYLKKYTEYSFNKNNDNCLTKKYEDLLVFRGFSNSKYYMPDNTTPDLISYYHTSDIDGDFFFERSLFSSYSICMRSAQHFMVAFNSQRRCLIHGYISVLDYRIFSSFIVSPAFYELQYEILSLPSIKPLYIYSNPQNEIYQSFKITLDD